MNTTNTVDDKTKTLLEKEIDELTKDELHHILNDITLNRFIPIELKLPYISRLSFLRDE